MVVFMISSSSDDNMLQQWHIFLGVSTESLTLAHVKKFIEKLLAIFESMEVRTKTQANSKLTKKGPPSNTFQPIEKEMRKCILCSEEHSFFKFDVQKSKEDMDRVSLVNPSFCEHALTACTLSHMSVKCRKKHRTFLHFNTICTSHSAVGNS